VPDRHNANTIDDDAIDALYAEIEALRAERDELALLLDLANGLPAVYRIRKIPFIGTAVVRAGQIEPIYTDTKAAADA